MADVPPIPQQTSEELRRTAEQLFEESRRLREQAERLRQQAEIIRRAVDAREQQPHPSLSAAPPRTAS